MAVFKDTMEVLKRTSAIETKLTGVVNRISNVLYALFDIVESITKILIAAIRALDAIATFIRNAATTIDDNPLAKGPWKVIFTIAATLLRGVAVIVEGVAKLLKTLQKAASNNLLKKLDDAIAKVDDVFLTYGKIIGKAQLKTNQLMALCRLLEKQQEKIEKANPTLRKSVNKNILDPIKKLLDSVEPVADSLSDIVDKLDAELTRLKKIAKLLQSLEKLANTFRGVIGSFVAAVKRLFLAIKQIILSIPFLGWLLDQLDQFIRAAIRAVGLEAILNKLANQLKNLPFIKRLLDLANQLKDFIENLLELIAKIEKKLQEAIKKFKAITDFTDKAIERFKKLALTKKKLEQEAIPRVTTMREELSNGLVALEKNNYKEAQSAISTFEDIFWVSHDEWLDGPDSMFGVEVYVSFFQYAEVTFDFINRFNEAISTEHAQPLVFQHIEHTINLLKVIEAFNQDVPELPDNYFSQLDNTLGEIEAPEPI